VINERQLVAQGAPQNAAAGANFRARRSRLSNLPGDAARVCPITCAAGNPSTDSHAVVAEDDHILAPEGQLKIAQRFIAGSQWHSTRTVPQWDG